ncbi:MAG: DMT family transporter [Spirochaetaceae bacterium]|nr:DMT family transporter [Spirochaetaceae bacterium]
MRRDIRAESLLVLTTLIWGGTFAVIKGALEDISPMLLVGIRFLLATALAWPILLRDSGSEMANSSPVRRRLFTPAAWFWGFAIGLGMLAGYAGQTIGLKYTTVARSGFITFSFALYVPFLQFLILRKRPGWGNLLGLFVVIWGLSIITDPATGPLKFGDLSPLRILYMARDIMDGGMNKGDLYTLFGAVGYAFYVVLLDKASRVCHPGVLTVIQMLFCGVFALVLVPFTEAPFLVISWRLAGAMFYLVVLGSILALALMNWFQRRLTPLRAVLIYALEPVFAALIGWLALGSGMSSREIGGAILILVGIVASDLWSIIAAVRKQGHRRDRRDGGSSES